MVEKGIEKKVKILQKFSGFMPMHQALLKNYKFSKIYYVKIFLTLDPRYTYCYLLHHREE